MPVCSGPEDGLRSSESGMINEVVIDLTRDREGPTHSMGTDDLSLTKPSDPYVYPIIPFTLQSADE